MPESKLRYLVHFHGIVFIFGFTSILGALITIDAFALVWYRMGLASILIALYFIVFQPNRFRVARPEMPWIILGGLIIAVHWITFFYAIKIAGVSLTLSMMSTGALITALLEPLWYQRKIRFYEVGFGCLTIVGIALIFQAEIQHILGLLIAFLSALLSAVFTLLNGRLVRRVPADSLSFYQLFFGTILMSVLSLFQNRFTVSFFVLSLEDMIWLLVLASICTAYAFIASIHVMKGLSPYTIMMTINLEPIYGILFSLLIFKDREFLSPLFYVGMLIVLSSVFLNGLFKIRQHKINQKEA